MANRTVKDAKSIHGTNPQYLVEKIIRTRIYDSKYWKEECFALTAELLVDKAMNLRYIGGVYGGNIKPSPFICLVLKMLQIQPEKDIVIEFIKQDEFKYVRALGCFYLRLVHSSLDCYKYLSPLLNDYRKLRIMDRNGVFYLSHMDEFIDNILREERFCDVIMPRIQKRWVHEANNELEPRISLLEDDLDDLESESDEEEEPIKRPDTPPSPRHRPERGRHSSPARDKRRRSLSGSPDHKRRRSDKEHDRGRERDTRRHREVGRGDRETGRGVRDHHYGGSYNPEGHHHDYNHGGHEYNVAATEYHHRRPHHYSNGTDNHYHHHHSRAGGDDDHRRRREHRRGEEESRRDRRDEREPRNSRRDGRSRHEDNNNVQAEIDEANALRAKLGLPPLK